nr:MAG TPA: Putative ATP dependent Clp protease [Caudoviricetes sp.]
MANQSELKIMNLKTDGSGKNAELTLYGDIGDSFWEDISAKRLVQELETLDVENITLNISSNGGGATAAIAIANALKRHKARVIANIDGIAASAATIITSACDIVRMPKNALFMIHNPWTIAMGEEKDFEKMAETLSKVKNSIIETYIDKTGMNKEKLSELMDKESWFNANEAKEYGFVDEITDNTDMEIIENKILSHGMVFNMTKFKNFKISNNSNVNNKKEEDKMTLAELKSKFPEFYDQVFNEGKEAGINKENERMKAIDEMKISNYPELVESAKYTEKIEASELAMKVLKKQNEEKAEKLEGLKNESQSNFIPPIANNGTEEKSETKKFMGVDIANILSKMNKKTEEGK